jgi:hypothetical protein
MVNAGAYESSFRFVGARLPRTYDGTFPSIIRLKPGMKDRTRLFHALAVVALFGALALPASAHHAFSAEFDANEPIDLSGTVTKFKWTNPHSWLYFDVADKDGRVTNWGVEFGAPNSLENKGLKKSDIKVGDSIHIVGYRAKNGGPFGYSVTASLADGRVIQTGGAQDAPSAANAPAKY